MSINTVVLRAGNGYMLVPNAEYRLLIDSSDPTERVYWRKFKEVGMVFLPEAMAKDLTANRVGERRASLLEYLKIYENGLQDLLSLIEADKL